VLAAPAPAAAAAPPWTWARARDLVLTLLGVCGLVYVAGLALRMVAGVVLLFVLAALLAFILRPLVDFVARHTGWSRTWAALLCYLLAMVLLAAAGTWAIAQLVTQATAAVTGLPETYRALQERLPLLQARAGEFGIPVDIAAVQAQLLAGLQGAGLAAQGLAWAQTLGDSVLNLVLVLFLSFYLVLDGERLGETLVAISPTAWKPYALFVKQNLTRVVGGYLRGQMLMGAIVGLSVFAGCLVLGVRYSLLLGVLGFFFEMIPMVGPTLVGVAMTAVAFSQSVHLALLALGFYLLLQLVESNVLGPRITGQAVGLHPIASILGLVAGAKLFGIWGALFAVPALGFAFVIVAAVCRQARGMDPGGVLARRRPLGRWPIHLAPFHVPIRPFGAAHTATHAPSGARGGSLPD
jgi:predicted PurR-regulated permease PerM